MSEQNTFANFGYLFQTFGLQYFAAKNINSESFMRKISIYSKIYFSILMVFLMTSFFVEPNFNDYFKIDHNIKYIKHLLIDFIVKFAATFSCFSSFILVRKNKMILKNALEVKEMCQLKFKSKVSFIKFKVKVIISIVILFSTTILSRKLQADTQDVSRKEKPKYHEAFCYFILMSTLIKFIYFMELISILCEQLCKNARKMLFTVKESDIQLKFDKQNFDVENMMNIMEVFLKIKEISFLLNDTMGLVLLIYVTFIVLIIFLAGFDLFVVLSFEEIRDIKVINLLSVSVFFFIVLLFLITMACRRNENIMNKLIETINKSQAKRHNQITEEQIEVLTQISSNISSMKIQFTLGKLSVIDLNFFAGVNRTINVLLKAFV